MVNDPNIPGPAPADPVGAVLQTAAAQPAASPLPSQSAPDPQRSEAKSVPDGTKPVPPEGGDAPGNKFSQLRGGADGNSDQDRSWTYYFGAADDPKELWEACQRIDHPTGLEPQGGSELMREWASSIRGCTGVIVTGDVPGEAQWVAEYLASVGHLGEVRRTSYPMLGNRLFPSILWEISRAPDRRLVIDYWPPRHTDALARSLGNLSAAIERQTGERCQLIVWTQPAICRPFDGAGRTWPENIKLVPVETVRPLEPGPDREEKLDLAFYRNLFGANLTSIADVSRAHERVIEQSLVRVAVLFGQLPADDVDALMHEVLESKKIRIAGQEPKLDRQVPARELWTSGKDLFLRKAGLVRADQQGQQIVRFAEDTARDAASTAAWDDTQAMLAAFAASAKLGPLFDGDIEPGRRELFEGFVEAAAGLARHAPRSLAGCWLTIVRDDLVRWMQRVHPAVSLAEGTLPETLGGLAGLNQRTRLAILRHVARRLGYLSLSLVDAAPALVEDLLAGLLRAKNYEAFWLILVELRSWPYEPYFTWLNRLLSETAFARESRNMVGRELAHSPEACGETLGQFARWIPATNAAPSTSLERAAIDAPFQMIDEMYTMQRRKRPSSVSLAGLLSSAVDASAADGATLQGYFEDCFLLAARHNPDGPTSIAVALLQMLLVTAASERDSIVTLASTTKRRLTAAQRSAVLAELHEIVEWTSLDKSELPLTDATKTQREQLTEHVNLCRTLIRA